ncbi:MAG: hypothetical protein M3214_06750 [Actinomycetota bacterium]|nr:hypothetical protein [Actinomycetota bacterium]
MPRFAHETWFTEQRPPYSWEFTFEPATMAAIAAVVVAALAWRVVASRLPTPELGVLSPLGRLAPWIPRLLGVHAGVSLLAQAASGSYLAPSLELPHGRVGTLLALLEGITGVWLIAGYRIRPAAMLLAVAGPLGAIGYGIVPILERVDLLGIAVFLSIVPPDDAAPGGRTTSSPEGLATALFSLRLLVGGSLIVLAFTEKLARPDLALAFLDHYPALNVLQSIGLDVPNLTFVRIAGAVELLFGLLIISGAMPQVAVIAAGIPFNATLLYFGESELIGHLPVYGAMLALLVYGSHKETAHLVPWLPIRRWDRVADASARPAPDAAG